MSLRSVTVEMEGNRGIVVRSHGEVGRERWLRGKGVVWDRAVIWDVMYCL
jgi:hypothetical protein